MIKQCVRPLLGVALVLCLDAQTQQTVAFTARIESRCRVELSTSAITFTRLEPTADLWIRQNEAAVAVVLKATLRSNERVNLRIVATGDLVEQRTGRTIEAANIRWEVSGAKLRSGTLNTAAPRLAGQFNQSGVYEGLLTFYLMNRDDYPPGTYDLTIQLTASGV